MSSPASSSPAELGYRWPAEWEPHAATWLSWPKNPETWPGGLLARVERTFVEIVAALTEGEGVRINVDDAAAEQRVRGLLRGGGVDPGADVEIFRIPTDDAWVRDHGPLFVVNEQTGARAIVDFEFDAWGGKYPPWDRDDAVPGRVADTLGLSRFEGGIVLEPGSIEGDGAGAVITTESCLLHPNRGAGGRPRARDLLEQRLRAMLGAERVIWLGDGIEGDDTDGHVDDLTRFVSPGRLVTAVESDSRDPNFAPLQRNLRRLRGLRDAAGRPYEIAEIPMPPPIVSGGDRLPASYANFYIANRVVLLPTFGVPADERAASILAECLPARRVVPIDSRDLVVGLGALHCLTQQEPAPPLEIPAGSGRD